MSGASISATKVALTIAVRRALERRQFGPPGRARRRCCWTTARTSGGCCPALATTYALTFAQQRLVDELHEVFTDRRADDRARRELETLAAGVKAVATWHASDDDPELPRGVRRRGLPAHEPLRRAEGRHRRLHHLRGRQHGPAAARGQEPADRLPGRVRRARPARAGAVRRRPGARACWPSARRCAARDTLPDATTRRPARARDAARAVPLAPRAPARERGPAAQGRHRRRRATRSRCSSTARTTCSRPRARGSTSVVLESFPAATRPCSTRCAASTRCTRSRPSAAGTRSTAGCPARARRPSSRPSTRSAASCGRTRGSWSTPSACRRTCSATRASWPRSAVAA